MDDITYDLYDCIIRTKIKKLKLDAIVFYMIANGYEMNDINKAIDKEVVIKKSITLVPPTNDTYEVSRLLEPMYYKEKERREKEKDEKAADYNLKLVSISSMELNKKFGKYALLIAILTAVVPIGIYLNQRNDTQKVETEIPQLKDLQSTLKDIKEGQDSLIKILNDSASKVQSK